MTNYWDLRFLSKLDGHIRVIFEVGARYGDETLMLDRVFEDADIYSFECNPRTVEGCRRKLEGKGNIHFIDKGLGNENTKLPFYSFVADDNDGASSFYKRIDEERTQDFTGYVEVEKLSDVMSRTGIGTIDLLCMDVQGYELNVLRGAGSRLGDIRYIIMEEPKPIPDPRYLPSDVHSSYIGSPKPDEIAAFMLENGFIEIERISENLIEDNVLYKNARP